MLEMPNHDLVFDCGNWNSLTHQEVWERSLRLETMPQFCLVLGRKGEKKKALEYIKYTKSLMVLKC